MYHTIKAGKDASALRLDLDKGEAVYAAPKSLVACGHADEDAITLTATQTGGLLRGLAQAFGRKTPCAPYDVIEASHRATWLMLCPQQGNAITAIAIHAPVTLLFRTRAFLAAQASLTLGTTLPREMPPLPQGSPANPMLASGEGVAFLAAHGAVESFLLQEGQSIRVDATHLLAWESSLALAPMKSGLFKKAAPAPWGDGKTLLDLRGRGRFWLQTRAETSSSRLPDRLPHRAAPITSD